MAEAYASCASYRDSGVATTKITDGPIMQRPFKTAFVRPDRLRFEFSQWMPLSKMVWVVWCEGAVVRTWSSVTGWKRPASLGLGLAEATGVSGGTAQTVPKLLLPGEVSGVALTDLANVERIADADVGAARCYCLRGRLADFTMTLWIDQKTYLLLRLERVTQSDSLDAEEVTTYEPEMNILISDAELEFIPPS
jgi:outer membrane lipoprotein-sorting protein